MLTWTAIVNQNSAIISSDAHFALQLSFEIGQFLQWSSKLHVSANVIFSAISIQNYAIITYIKLKMSNLNAIVTQISAMMKVYFLFLSHNCHSN